MFTGTYKYIRTESAPRPPPALELIVSRPTRRATTTGKNSPTNNIMNDAELYHKHNSLQKKDAIESLQEYANKIKWRSIGGRVMDVGCGDGDVTTTVLKKLLPMDVKKVVGCDINHEMVHFANKLYGDERTQFIVMDIGGEVPAALHGGFDHVFSSYVLHWIKQQQTAISNIYKLLDDGGDCLLVFIGHMQIYDIYRVLSNNNKWSKWLSDVDKYVSPYHDSKEPQKEVKRLMTQTGFKKIDVQCKNKMFMYDSIQNLKKAVKAVNPFDIPKELMDDYLEDYVDVVRSMHMTDQLNNNDEDPVTVSFEYGLIVAYGTK